MATKTCFTTTEVGKLLAQRGLKKLDQKATEVIIAADKTLDDVNAEIKLGLGGLALESFSEEISAFTSIFGLEVDPTIIANVGKVAQVAAAASVTNKFIDNFNETDIDNLDKESILALLDPTEVLEELEAINNDEL